MHFLPYLVSSLAIGSGLALASADKKRGPLRLIGEKWCEKKQCFMIGGDGEYAHDELPPNASQELRDQVARGGDPAFDVYRVMNYVPKPKAIEVINYKEVQNNMSILEKRNQ